MGGGASKKAEKHGQKGAHGSGKSPSFVEDEGDAFPFAYEPLKLPDIYEEARRSKADGKLSSSRDLVDVLARHGTFCKLSEADAMMIRFCGSIYPTEGIALDAISDMLAATPAVSAKLKHGSPWSVWAQSLDLASIIGSAVQTILPALHPEHNTEEIISLSEDDATKILAVCKKALVQSLVQGAESASARRRQPPPDASRAVSLISNLNIWTTSSDVRPIHELLGTLAGNNSLLESLQLELCNPELKRPSSAAKNAGTMSKSEWDALVRQSAQELQGAGGAPTSPTAVKAGLDTAEWIALKVMLGVMGQQYDKYLGRALKQADTAESPEEEDNTSLNVAMLTAASGLEKLRRVREHHEGKIYLGLDGGVLPTALWPYSSSGGADEMGVAASSFLVASADKHAAVGAANARSRGGLPVVLEVTATGDCGAIPLDWLGSNAAGLVAISPLSTLVVSGEPRLELVSAEEEVVVVPVCVANTTRNKTLDELSGWRQSMLMHVIEELRGCAEADVQGLPWSSIVSSEFDRLQREIGHGGAAGLADDREYRRLLDTAIDVRIGCQEKTRALTSLGSSLRVAENKIDVGSAIESILEQHADVPENGIPRDSVSEDDDVALPITQPPADGPEASAFFLDLLLAVPAIEFARQGFTEWLFTGFSDLPWEALALSEVCDVRWKTRCEDAAMAWEMMHKAGARGRKVRVRAQDGSDMEWDVEIVEALLGRLRESEAETEDLRLNGPDVLALAAPILIQRDALRSVHLAADVPIRDILSRDHLSLASMSMGLEESVLLASAVAASTSLTSLDLRNNAFTPAGETAIANALQSKRELTSFNGLALAEGQSEWDVASISAAVLDSSAVVDGDSSHAEAQPLGVMEKAFAASRVAANPQLQELDGLSFSDMQEKWALGGRALPVYMLPFLAAQLPRCQRLHTLNLSWSAVDAELIEWVGPALAQMPALTHLDVSKNRLGPPGCFKLGRVFSNRSGAWKLLKLNVSSNSAGDQGCAAIAASLPSIPALEHLNLSDNDVSGLGYMSLATFARAVPKLQAIYLGGAGVDEFDSGFSALRMAIPAACSLK